LFVFSDYLSLFNFDDSVRDHPSSTVFPLKFPGNPPQIAYLDEIVSNIPIIGDKNRCLIDISLEKVIKNPKEHQQTSKATTTT